AGGAAFAAAVRMVDRVHGHAAIVRALAAPAGAAGLAVVDVAVLGVRHRADRRHARAMDNALLARVQAQDRMALVAADELDVGAGRARDLTALARLQLDIVDYRADRHRAQRHGVARLDVDALAGDDLVAHGQALRRQDVGQLAVLILDEGDERRAVRVVLQPLHRRRNVELATLEVDDAIGALVPAADEAAGDA